MNAPFVAQSVTSAAWLADVMLRLGGWITVLDFQCAFDESGTHAGSPVLCVAGYIMEKDQARELDREWNEVLNWDQLPHPLPYFHMSECAPDPGNGPFADLTKAQRIQVVSRLIGVIKRRTVMGLAATVSISEFDTLLAGHPFYPDPYVLASHMILQGVAKWIETNPEIVRQVAYFFETGHASRQDADAIMRRLFGEPRFKDDYRYAGHAFVPKIGNPIVQAADLLAWQWLKDRKSVLEGRPRRKDLISLLDHPHGVAHISPEILAGIAATRKPLVTYLLAQEQPS